MKRKLRKFLGVLLECGAWILPYLTAWIAARLRG